MAMGSVPATAQTPPIITQQPAGIIVDIGSTVTMNGGVAGNNLTYQWLKDGVALPGQTTSSISFSPLQFTQCGNYQLVASNDYGMAITWPAFLSISNAPFYAWGDNFSGQLGLGTTGGSTNKPLKIASNVTALAAGGQHSLFVKNDTSLWAMGANGTGQLGIGTTGSTNVPTLVASNVVAAAAGWEHSFFIKSDGTLWGMGANGAGQLGIGTTGGSTNVPTLVTSNVVEAAAGWTHSLFIKSDGTLWSMGNNNFGQLGIGAVSATNVPCCVASNVIAAAAGQQHSLFVKSDGTLWAMGSNSGGKLGKSSFNGLTNRPICVASNVVTVTAGYDFSLFLKSDGTLWGMGNDSEGQVGATTPSGSSYVNVASNVMAVGAGYEHSLFTKTDGTLWGMGWNGGGQLGGGSPGYAAFSPVQVPFMTVASLGGMGSTESSLVVGALIPQLIPLTNRIVNLGQPVTFSVTVTNGTGPFTYQWQFNGTNLIDATNNSYGITHATLAEAGTYTILVGGLGGPATGSATLTVIIPPPILKLDAGNSTASVQTNLLAIGQPGYLYLLQATTNLATGQWTPVQTNIADSYGNCPFTAPDSAAPAVYYRIVSP